MVELWLFRKAVFTHERKIPVESFVFGHCGAGSISLDEKFTFHPIGVGEKAPHISPVYQKTGLLAGAIEVKEGGDNYFLTL